MDPEGRPWLWWPGESGIAKELPELPSNAWINGSLEICIHEEQSKQDLEEGFMKGQYDEPNK